MAAEFSHAMRVRALDAYVRFRAPMPISPQDYLAERDAWQQAIGTLLERCSLTQASSFEEDVLVSIEVFRDQPWPWVRDLLAGATPDQIGAWSDTQLLRAWEHYAHRVSDAEWSRAAASEILVGLTARVALTRLALREGLYDHAGALIRRDGPREVVRSLLVHGGPGTSAGISGDLERAGVSRIYQMQSLFVGGVVNGDTRHGLGHAQPLELLLAVTAGRLDEMHEMVVRLDRIAKSGLVGMAARQMVLNQQIPIEVCEEVHRVLLSRIAMQSCPVPSITMASP